MTLLMVLKESD